MQVETVVTLELNQVLGSSSEEGQAVRETAGAARASAEPGQGVPATSAFGFLHFHHKVFALYLSATQTLLSALSQQPPNVRATQELWEEVETAGRVRVQRCHDELLPLCPHIPGLVFGFS